MFIAYQQKLNFNLEPIIIFENLVKIVTLQRRELKSVEKMIKFNENLIN